MKKDSSGRASTAEGRVANRRMKLAGALFMVAGGFAVNSGAYAQASQDAASCVEKCKADEKTCLNNGSSEEMCDYDSKGCQKACS